MLEPGDVRLVGGASRCAGILELKHLGEWRPVIGSFYVVTAKVAAVFCEHLDCGSVVNVEKQYESTRRSVWRIEIANPRSALRDVTNSAESSYILHATCLDSVRLLNGSNLCSGRLQVKSNQKWFSVCEADFDLQDAEVVCRELGCGPPSVLQRALYGEVEAPVWSKEFQCEGHESALLDCRSSSSARNSCSPGKAVGLTCSESLGLVGGASRCAGALEFKHLEEWRQIQEGCRRAGNMDYLSRLHQQAVTTNMSQLPHLQHFCTNIYAAPDSVRLLNGSSLCSGRLQVKSNQKWSSVCEADFDLQDAEVVCREFSCGPPLVLQGGLYGEVEAPVWSKEFQCEGHESALLDCRSAGSARNSCSPGKAVGLTCSEPVRLVGGASRCAGTLEFNHQGNWSPVSGFGWSLKEAAVVCEHLGCGSVVFVGQRDDYLRGDRMNINPDCVHSGPALKDCATLGYSSYDLDLKCSDSVRLLNGSNLCSGRLQVKSNQEWSSVCEADFDLQDAEVVCREFGCGPPSVLQRALYGEVEAPVWSKEFQCGGHESALLDCRSSGSARHSCSSGKAVGLTCSESHVRLLGGASRCAGTLEVKHLEEWRPVHGSDWTLKEAAVVCEHLDCGSAVYVGEREDFSYRSVWEIKPDCVHCGQIECATSTPLSSILDLTCSDSVRLLNGSNLCSGRLQVKSNQKWSSVCEADFDLQDAEVVCREFGCGPPLVLQGALYGEVEAPVWSKEFQCGGHESALLDCRSSGSARHSCSPGKAVGLTCSALVDVRLEGGASRCAGTLEVKVREWRPLADYGLFREDGYLTCEHLNCEVLVQPIISVSSSMDMVSEAQQHWLQLFRGSSFNISCSIQPQYPGGFFQLTFTSSNTSYNYTRPAVNHSAHFLFPAAEPAHQGSYSCLYHVHALSHSFYSESHQLSVSVSDPTGFIIRAVVLPLILLLENLVLYFYCKASRGRKLGKQENIELVDRNLGGGAAEGGPAEEEGVQGAEEDL
ncbi:scavenger receptor cysteine-rich type 1 protein M160-like [Pelmatolapia mariae]|uniref:scavenger receptor cysteine-rich type 1 protein M160-like n=1 Tax=Pelmatolapia mariae TaxID=158779 RepID=UPI003211D0AA